MLPLLTLIFISFCNTQSDVLICYKHNNHGLLTVANKSMTIRNSLSVTCLPREAAEQSCDGIDQIHRNPKDINIHNCSPFLLGNIVDANSIRYRLNLEGLRSMNLSHNNLPSVSHELFRGIKKLLLLDLSHNNIQHIQDDAFYRLKSLMYLMLNNNHLQTLDLMRMSSVRSPLIHLDVSFNRMRMIDVGAGVFSQLKTLNMSHNIITSYHPTSDIRINFDSLEVLDISHNNISGTLLSADLNIFVKNSPITVDLSFNNITRIDLRKTATDRFLASHSKYERKSTTIYDISNNPLVCDCFVPLLRDSNNLVTDQKTVFKSFQCVNDSDDATDDLLCPLPDYYGMADFNVCPDSCDCSYNLIVKQVTVNCSSRGLENLPDNLPDLGDDDDLILLLNNNKITSFTQDWSNINITYLDVSNNLINNINQDLLPATLQSLNLDNNRMEVISVGFLNQMIESKTRFSLANNTLLCSCSVLDLYSHASDFNETILCNFGNFNLDSDVVEMLCDDTVRLYVGIVAVFIVILIIYFVLKIKRGPSNTIYDVFISYSHHDAIFAEQVKNLCNEKLKNILLIRSCIHIYETQESNVVFIQFIGR